MVNDAEKFADEDKKKADLIQARNEADQLAYTTEKTLKDHGDKISEEDKKNVEDAITELKTALESESVETINSAKEKLMTASHKLAEAMYKATQEEAGQQQAQPEGEAQAQAGSDGDSSSSADGAVDADFEVVDDEKK